MSEEAEKKENGAQAQAEASSQPQAEQAAEQPQAAEQGAEAAASEVKDQAAPAEAGAESPAPAADAKAEPAKAEPAKEETPEEKLQKELASLKEENQKLKGEKDDLSRKLRDSGDKVQAAIRQLAENANEMKRMAGQKEREVQNAKDFAIQNFAKELLTVADDLDKALESMQKDGNEAIKAHIAGIELTKKALVKALAAGGVAEVEAKKGDVFDPNVEQQVAMIPFPSAKPDTLVDIIQKGYTLNGRCIRAAKVVVVAPRPEEEEQQPEEPAPKAEEQTPESDGKLDDPASEAAGGAEGKEGAGKE
ncbi:MAG: nucleotide exchange factor GrpE [Proteobacteria bacterium]|nr:nucleotide exchange factor GrpE [Pseudomonadota bacterium]